MTRTDPDLAQEAKAKANKHSTGEFDIIGWLCPACNQPAIPVDPDPNEYVHEPDEGEFGVDRKAYQISPERILELKPENPLTRICVYPETVEYDDGEHLRVTAYLHDHSTERYQAWERELESLKDTQRRSEENTSLNTFSRGDEA